jgi:DNA sulfur modification protein DndD
MEGKIGSEGGGFAKNRETLVQKQASVKTLIGQHESTIKHLCEGLLPFALCTKLLARLQDQINREADAEQVDAGRAVLKSAKEELLKRLAGMSAWEELKPLSKPVKKKLSKRLEAVVCEPFSAEGSKRPDLIHRLSAGERQQVIGWICQTLDTMPKLAHETGDELERLYRELHRLTDALRKVPAEEVLRPLIAELHQLHEALAKASQQAIKTDEEIRATETLVVDKERRYKQVTEKLAQEASSSSRINLTFKIQSVLDKYKATLLERKVRELELAVSECFNTLCRKKDNLRRIRVDPKDFSVTFYDQRGQPLSKQRLSAGEKQIYAISMLWALGKTSRRPLPMIIDTPLARLDSDHRSLLVNHYFPAASHQVIILSTDTEVDQTYFTALRSSISHAYRVEFSQQERSSSIMPGYFGSALV